LTLFLNKESKNAKPLRRNHKKRPSQRTSSDCCAFSGLLWTKQFYYYDVLNGFGGPGEAQPIVLTRATQAGNTY
jgi:hypothetical protein